MSKVKLQLENQKCKKGEIMSLSEYSKQVLETESPIDTALITRASQNSTLRLLHAAMGLSTESGEFVDAVKRHVFYGKDLDKQNLAEELGDLLWYVAIAADQLGLDLGNILQSNLLKLKARYPNGFKPKDAINRDTTKEQSSLKTSLNLESDYADGPYTGE